MNRSVTRPDPFSRQPRARGRARLGETVIAYLDTHAAVWLHDGLVERLSAEAKRRIEASDLLISPMVLLELQYLFDRQRTGVEPMPMYAYLQATFGVGLCSYAFPGIVLEAAMWVDE